MLFNLLNHGQVIDPLQYSNLQETDESILVQPTLSSPTLSLAVGQGWGLEMRLSQELHDDIILLWNKNVRS